MLRPLRGYVLIEPIKDTEKTAVGVYLPETVKDKPMKGRVVNVGEGKIVNWKEQKMIGNPPEFIPFEEKLEINIDDIVYYKKWGNEEVKEDGKEYVFVKFGDLLGVYEK